MLIIDLIGECGEARKTICTPEWCRSVSVREADEIDTCFSRVEADQTAREREKQQGIER